MTFSIAELAFWQTEDEPRLLTLGKAAEPPTIDLDEEDMGSSVQRNATDQKCMEPRHQRLCRTAGDEGAFSHCDVSCRTGRTRFLGPLSPVNPTLGCHYE